jgi:hypothetical protein
MDALRADEKTPEEAVIYWMIVGTWALWALGALYHVYPVLAWTLAAWGGARRLGLLACDPAAMKPVPAGVWVWGAGMSLMAMTLVIGHLNFDFPLATIVKSLFGWAKGWALFAVLPFAGASLRIRPQVLIRAVNVLSAQTLILAPLFVAASMTGLPPVLYTSPLYDVGGASHAFFEVGTHWVDPGSPDIRYRFFAPWGPAAALVAQVALVIGLYDRDWRWRIVAVASGVVVCYLAKSRLSLVAIPLIMLALPVLSNIHRPLVMGLGGTAAVAASLLFNTLTALVDTAVDQFNNARVDSSRVRATLQRIAYQRWQSEAPVFGHGAVERGPHLVEFMPIGSHHTWFGLLFVKGAVGVAALALPMLWTLVECLIKAQRDRVARAALGVVLVVFVNSFGENLEILGYLVWPGLLLIGIAMNRRRVGLWSGPLGSQH